MRLLVCFWIRALLSLAAVRFSDPFISSSNLRTRQVFRHLKENPLSPYKYRSSHTQWASSKNWKSQLISPVVKNIYVYFPFLLHSLRKLLCISRGKLEREVKKGFVIAVTLFNKIIVSNWVTHKNGFLTNELVDGFKALFSILKFQVYFANDWKFGRFLSPLKKREYIE